jgi:hypothetical protein
MSSSYPWRNWRKTLIQRPSIVWLLGEILVLGERSHPSLFEVEIHREVPRPMTMMAKLPGCIPAIFGTLLTLSNAAPTSALNPDLDEHQTSPRPFSALQCSF